MCKLYNIMQTAILFLVFNRPDVTQKVFKSIRKAKPSRLYVASDGPRHDRTAEKGVCEEVQKISTAIDWPCELHTLFREENLGCRVAVSTAIDWFFEYEKEGVILEDDCLPDQSFFQYCEQLLDKYRDDSRVMVISGDYFLDTKDKPDASYFFSRYNHCWGWATWKDAWKNYDRDMSQWPALRNTNWLSNIGDEHSDFVKYWKYVFDRAYAGKIDSWAYRWTFSCWVKNGLTALPSCNLVKNIGFNDDATHTKNGDKWKYLPLESMSFPLVEPKEVIRNISLDRLTDLNVVGTRVLLISKVKNKIKIFIKKIRSF